MTTYRPVEAIKAVAALYLLSPQIPMMFMGEEWSAGEPFPYFCDFDEELNAKVRKGRREELSRLPGFDADDLLDPTAYLTFASAKLDWSKLSDAPSSKMLAFYKGLLDIRRQRILPLLKDVGGKSGTFRREGKAISVQWTLAAGSQLHLLANLADQAATVHLGKDDSEQIFSLGSIDSNRLGPWSVVYSIGQHDIAPRAASKS